MSRYLEILADVKAKLEAVPNVGVVHDYERNANDLLTFIKLFVTQRPADATKTETRGWEITRRRVPEHRRGATFRHHHFRLSGYLALRDEDETSKDWQVVAEAVCDAFRDAVPAVVEPAWWYGDGDDPEGAPAQIEVMEDRMFGGVLCHCAEIALLVTERIV